MDFKGVEKEGKDNTTNNASGTADICVADVVGSRQQAFTVAESYPPVPDGCALDAEGMLWVALFGAGSVRRIDPRSGAVLAVVELPEEAGPQCTACAFGGVELDELYVTTARE